jgi:pilus assembly protein Flp/PilA
MTLFQRFSVPYSAIEYGLLAALIAVAAISVIGTVGTNLANTFSTVTSDL